MGGFSNSSSQKVSPNAFSTLKAVRKSVGLCGRTFWLLYGGNARVRRTFLAAAVGEKRIRTDFLAAVGGKVQLGGTFTNRDYYDTSALKP